MRGQNCVILQVYLTGSSSFLIASVKQSRDPSQGYDRRSATVIETQIICHNWQFLINIMFQNSEPSLKVTDNLIDY